MDTSQKEENCISSFVIRCYKYQEKDQQHAPWRIKVTHVQDNQSDSFLSLDDAMNFIKRQLEEGES